MSILVVIDMQPMYEAAQSISLRRRIQNRIRSHCGPVCIVEYKYEGSKCTYPGIMKACQGKRTFRCIKEVDDGGDCVVGATFAEGLGRHRKYILCGVNTAYCVLSTANGILRHRDNFKVLVDFPCCASPGDSTSSKAASEGACDVWLREDANKGRRKVVWL